MIEKHYICSLISDVVLPASSNTEGNVKLSDFIAGSNFLGVVAAHYGEFGEEAFDVFHSGKVCFEDAHLLINGKASFKIPLSFHNLKEDGRHYYNRIHLSDEEEKKLRDKRKQLKQVRNGYMTTDGFIDIPKYNYNQKSSRKQDEMFGYTSLQAGTKWYFSVEYSAEKDIESVENYLLGNKKIGKSKTSEYGAVLIERVEFVEDVEHFEDKDTLYIYAASRLALFDEDGNFTALPSIKNLGLTSGEIDWEKSFIRTQTFTPFNFKRQNYDYERVCIAKGSVIAIKDCQDEVLPSRVGAFLSEGFGKVLLNPSFLKPKEPELQTYKQQPNETKSEKYDDNLVSFLQSKLQADEAKFKVAKDVGDIYGYLIGPSKSQWGQIRTFASMAQTKEKLLSKIEEYISHGKEKKQWEGKKERLLKAIDHSSDPIAFTKLLAMTVSKTKGDKNGK